MKSPSMAFGHKEYCDSDTGDIGHFDNPSGGHQALLDIDQVVI